MARRPERRPVRDLTPLRRPAAYRRPCRSRPAARLAALAAGLPPRSCSTGCGGDDGGDAGRADRRRQVVGGVRGGGARRRPRLRPADRRRVRARRRGRGGARPSSCEQGAGARRAGARATCRSRREECDAAVQGTQPDLDDFDDVAAHERRRSATAVTVEMLVRGGPIEGAVDQLAAAAERCPQAQITSPEIGQRDGHVRARCPCADLGRRRGRAAVHDRGRAARRHAGDGAGAASAPSRTATGCVVLTSLAGDPAALPARPPDAGGVRRRCSSRPTRRRPTRSTDRPARPYRPRQPAGRRPQVRSRSTDPPDSQRPGGTQGRGMDARTARRRPPDPDARPHRRPGGDRRRAAAAARLPAAGVGRAGQPRRAERRAGSG